MSEKLAGRAPKVRWTDSSSLALRRIVPPSSPAPMVTDWAESENSPLAGMVVIGMTTC